MSRPVFNCSPRRYIGAISEAHMETAPLPLFENDGKIRRHHLSAPFLEQLLQERGIPIGTNLHLSYSMQTPAIERGTPALFAVYVTADNKLEIDQFYGSIMQVLQPYMHDRPVRVYA
jgi:hypothetical protein